MVTAAKMSVMKTVIPVKCPFCNTRGKIVTPRVGAMIVAPCPRCQEFLLVFAGTSFPLNKHVILHASAAEQQAHLAEMIMEHIEEWVEDLLETDSEPESDSAPPADADQAAEADAEAADPAAAPGEPRLRPSWVPGRPTGPITEAEARDFLTIDVPLSARKAYFDRVFGPR